MERNGQMMADTNGGADAAWDAACERMAAEANATADACVVTPGGTTGTALAVAVVGAWAECDGICNATGYDVANPEPDEQRPADYAARAWQSAAHRMLEHMERVREIAECVASTGKPPADWDAACQRMAAQVGTAPEVDWRSLALELAEVATNSANNALVVTGRAEPFNRPRSVLELTAEMARVSALHTLEAVDRVREVAS